MKLKIINIALYVQLTSDISQKYFRSEQITVLLTKQLSKEIPKSILSKWNSIIFDNSITVRVNDAGFIHSVDDGFDNEKYDQIIDAEHGSIIPGLVDGHTHSIWSGNRLDEFSLKLDGVSYLDILQNGGGIIKSVKATTKSSEDELEKLLIERLEQFAGNGTTTVEVKTGYGHTTECEKKCLRVLTKCRDLPHLPNISITYLPAHSLPPKQNENEVTNFIISEQFPVIDFEIKSGNIHIDNFDVFCEKKIFERQNTEKLLKKAKELFNDINLNVHVEEFENIGGAELAIDMEAKSISHFEEISSTAIDRLAKSETVAIGLPTTMNLLQLPCPPVKRMWEKGSIIGLGTDFNPNMYCPSMPITMHLAAINYRLGVEMILCAATLNSAFSLGLEKEIGSLNIGKRANLIILKCARWENIIYQLGNERNLIRFVIRNGMVIYGK
ncbi:hypothetical protein SNEBB_001852 [Seison nebaliae]|nr:hypothetical protein SNEBB_001852 [Seison nebaliae]